MATTQQPDHHPTIQSFRKWVDDNSVTGTLGDTERPNTRFMIAQRLEAHLKEEFHSHGLLQMLWDDGHPPLQPQDILGRYSKGFAILLLMGMGKYIHHFVQYASLSDDHMPFDPKVPPANFPTTDACPDFFAKFVERQWQFFPHHFRNSVDTRLPPECILPIRSKVLIGTGGFADLYKITVYAGYDGLTPPLDQGRDANSGFANTYVLKTYRTQDAESHYRNEIDAFQRLRGQPDCLGKVVIGFYGSFIQDRTYNTLIEYAGGGTLEDFLQKNDPPTDAEDIYKLWSAVFELTKAIQIIHSLGHDENGPPILRGWHQDIKPSNILVTNSKQDSPFDVQFKLADLGLAHFRKITSKNRDEADRDTQGTRIYGAPECYRFDDFDQIQRLEVKQSVDIWSLGCVYSEIAVWLVLGKGALLRYREDRRVETAERADFTDHGCFHNGETVLKCVKNIHTKVFTSIRESDHITKAVIRKMVEEMLDHFDGRPNARQLRRKALNILYDAERAEEERKNGGDSPGERQRETYSNRIEPRRLPARLPPDRIIHNRVGQVPEFPDPRPLKKKSQTFDSLELAQQSPAASLRESLESPVGDTMPMTQAIQDPVLNSGPTLRLIPPPGPASLNHESSSQLPQSASQQRGALSPDYTSNGARALVPGPSNTQSNMTDAPVRPPLPGNPNSSPSSNRTSWEGSPAMTEATQHDSHLPTPPDIGIDEGGGPLQAALANGDRETEVAAEEKPKLPNISLRDLEHWILQKKQTPNFSVPLKNKDDIMHELGLRDHVFLIDDAGSMKDYWNVEEGVIHLAKALAYIVKASDKDGMDLYFTCTSDKYNVSSATSMESRLRSKSTGSRAKSNMAASLSLITEEYEKHLRSEKSTPAKRRSLFKKAEPLKRLNIYVFTDAVWQPHCDVGEVIASLANTMKELKYPRRQVGIQFIQFGNDPVCTKKLKDLDEGAVAGIPKEYDIVDTEPAVGGNCWKMLVGAINKWYDNEERPVSQP